MSESSPQHNPLDQLEALAPSPLERMHGDLSAVFHRSMIETIRSRNNTDKDSNITHSMAENLLDDARVRRNLIGSAAVFNRRVPVELGSADEAKIVSLALDSAGGYIVRLDLFSEGRGYELGDYERAGNSFNVIVPAQKTELATEDLPYIEPVAATVDDIEKVNTAIEGHQALGLTSHYLVPHEVESLILALSDLQVDQDIAPEVAQNLFI